MAIGVKRTAAAAAAVTALGVAVPAFAGDTITFDNGVKFDWALTTTYTLSSRLNGPNSVLAGNAGGNDGDNNFAKGTLTNNLLSGLLETKVYKGNTGFVLSASSFYDDVYHHANDNQGPVNHFGAPDQFTTAARYYQGGYSRLLDAYGYTSFDIGSSRATVRLGQHVVSWGEALFFPSISLAQGPADGTKTGIPGTQVKDQLLPEDQISTDIQVTPRWTLLGQLQFNWHPDIAESPGAFMSTSDAVGPGAQCLSPVINGVCAFGKRQSDIRPSNFGQWGTGTRYRISDETELGLYFLNYKDRAPITQINAFAPGGTYQIRYFDNIKLLGATVSTLVGDNVSVAGEVSQKFGAPVLVNTIVNPATKATIPNPTRADITQVNVNALANIGRTAIADQMILLGELSWVHVSNVTAIQAPGVNALGAAAAYFPASSQLSMTQNALAAAVSVSLSYPGIFTDWDLSVPISYSQQLIGQSITGGVSSGGQGDKRFSVGATFTYRNNLQIGLTYLGFLGSPDLTLGSQRLLVDRNQISLVASYKF